MHDRFIAALFKIAKIWKQPKHPPVDEWVKKMWYTIEYDLAVKRVKFCNLQQHEWTLRVLCC